MPPTKTEVNEANKAQLTEWLDLVFEEPEDGWDSVNVDDMRTMLKNALDDPALVALLDQEEEDESDDDEETAEGDAADLSSPNPKTDLYSGVLRG